MKKLILVATIAIFGLGCSDGFQSEKSVALKAISEGPKDGDDTDVIVPPSKPACEMDTVDYELSTHLLSFEITGNNNIGFGFNLLNGFLKALSVSIKTEKGEMQSSMHLSDALNPNETIVTESGMGQMKKNEFNITLNAGQLGLDVGYFKQTPLYKLTEKTMDNNLQKLAAKLATKQIPWSSKVVLTYIDGDVIIPAGTLAGIRKGDQFKIYNMEYLWTGVPCDSIFMRKKLTTTPVAIMEVTSQEMNASVLTIKERYSDQNIELGAMVEVHNLPLANKEKSRSLARAVRLTDFESEKLMLPGGKEFDIRVFLVEQTTALLNKYGFYPRK